MIRPPLLKSRDKAVIVSPAGKIDADIVDKAASILHEWGLKVEVGENALSRVGRFSGSIEQRLSDLQKAMDDAEVNLIFCSRGGYGMVHLLDRLNFDGMIRNPKWVVGYSDITALHSALQSNGIISIHGPMAKHFAEEGASDKAVAYTKTVLTEGRIDYKIDGTKYSALNRKGKASGRLFGGNLSVFCGILGSRFAVIPKEGILFIEDIGEEPYRVDRMMYQLRLAGVFDNIKGLIVGRFTDYSEDNAMYGPLYESILEAVVPYTFPVCFGFPVGHVKDNYPLMMGAETALTVTNDQIILKQK
ncbi:MAG TPA: LD-carboxypeptidase [Dysgonamonadaceae bacterium]|nr:LD-carboxypeptidase [Dysgonamonadaceae bacterium]